MHPRFLAAALLAAAGLLGVVTESLLTRTSPLAEVESALQLHVSGLAAHSAGDRDGAAVRFERACRLRHEPSCQAVWLQLDLGAGPSDDGARARLDGAARRLASATGGTWFAHDEEESYVVRIYCPVEREADLRGELESLRSALGG